jgi:ABC-type amino acid transport substrate-binding protein/serine phosphatase RsbU (regulator of sigma subunit)
VVCINLQAQNSIVTLTADEQIWVNSNPIVYHGYDPEWKPVDFVDENGKYVGITSDYLSLIGPKVGIDFQPYPGIKTWSEAIDLLKSGEILLLPALAQNTERNAYLDFTDTYLSHAYVIVSKKEGDFIGGLDFLENKKVATPENYYITGLLEQEQINMDLVYKSGTEDCLMAVSTGEADVTVVNIAVVSHYLNYSGFEDLKIASPTRYPDMEVKMGVAKNNQELVSILQKGISAISDKEKNEIVQNWVSVEYEHGTDMAKVWTISGIVGGIVFLIFASFYYYNRKLKKEILLRKKAQGALNKSFDDISDQKKIIEYKNEEVMASITYAQRLQKAILPTEEQISTALPQSFVLFLPKDIVSGDFYYLETKNEGNDVFFTSADCTGHGVPGAMVSLVCSNALHQAIIEDDLNKPSEILDSAKINLEKRFVKSGDNIKDGMDISFCKLNHTDKKLMYAGAYNPLWIVRHNKHIEFTKTYILNNGENNPPHLLESNDYHLIELSADRQPVGKYEYATPFLNHENDLLEADTIYLSSDGYGDQFGGEKGKKMKSKNFKKLLLEIQDQDMSTQNKTLSKHFFEWKGNYEQIDDVCIFGVKI